MENRGQISLYIIIGIILVILLALTIFIFSLSEIEEIKIPDTLNYKNLADGCTRQAAAISLYQIGLQGFEADPDLIDFSTEPPSTILLKDGISQINNIEEVEADLAELFRENFAICYEESLEGYASTISYGKTEVNMVDNVVEFIPDMIVNVIDTDSEKNIPLSSITHKVRLGLIHKFAEELIADQISHPNKINMLLAKDYNLTLSTAKTSNGNIMHIIVDERSDIEGNNFMVIFSVE